MRWNVTRHWISNMSNCVGVLSNIPRLSYHLRMVLPNLTTSDILPGRNDTIIELSNAEVIVADFDLLIPYVDHLPKTNWIQGTWAGADKLLPHLYGKDVNYRITRFSGINFGMAMSEYVISQIVNYERDQKRQYENQKSAAWIDDHKISKHRLIMDLTVGILGVGTIGKSIAKTLKGFGATIWGMNRMIPKEKLDFIDELRTTNSLNEILENCDYIINILPSTEESKGLLSGNVLEACKNKDTIFINIGRGSIINEKDLVNALEQKWLSAAILDVFENEPLPKSSKLWSMPQVTISPHVSGVTRPQDVAKLFAENYARYVKGEELLNILDINRGY
ncbi:uncharacterized protein LOC107264501 isoform X2 [Cephus cinctus]|uniref:Uncharacterized protein LOC107264501 isoform X2 n=1 Tax=Cephus cinctus TaxID=211228 RepID=A0AAJ7BKF1_CEPCN|nr:uncharacterized protein LOC107264501 isoform X2 [Cephus cinctus]